MDGIGQLLKLLLVGITNVVVGAAVLLLGGFVAYRALTRLWTEIRSDSGWGPVAYVKSLLQEPVALFESQQNASAAGSGVYSSGSYSELRWNAEDYFSDYDTTVHFVSLAELKEKHGGLPHGGSVIRSGKTGRDLEHTQTIEYKLTLDSNPEFTAGALCAFARAVAKLSLRGDRGCKTVFDIAPADLSPLSGEELRAHFL